MTSGFLLPSAFAHRTAAFLRFVFLGPGLCLQLPLHAPSRRRNRTKTSGSVGAAGVTPPSSAVAVRLGVPVIKVSRGLSPPSHFPVGFHLLGCQRRSGAARRARRTRVAPEVGLRGPHRSGRADFPHPALRRLGSLHAITYPLVQNRPAHPASSSPVPLSEFRCDSLRAQSLSHRSYARFQPTAPPFARRGPFGLVPPFHCSYCGAPTSRRPVTCSLPRDARSAQTGGGSRISQVPRQSLRTCRCLRSR